MLRNFIVLCLAFPSLALCKTCQTSEAIRDHVAIQAASGLVKFENSASKVVENIDNHFCVHTVINGNKRLSDDRHLMHISGIDSPFHSLIWSDFVTQNGLRVAFSDVDGFDNGATFEQAQLVCSSLTLEGASKGQWRGIRSRFGANSESNWSLSAESLLVYFANDNLYDFGRGRFWAASNNRLNEKKYT